MNGPVPPDVAVDAIDEEFWDGCRRREFLVHRCGACGRAYWPSTCCVEHGWSQMSWQPGTGAGEVHTYTVFHRAYLPWLVDRVPYVVAVVKLDDGPFFHTTLACAPSAAAVGMRVVVEFEAARDGWMIPYFRPAGGAEASG